MAALSALKFCALTLAAAAADVPTIAPVVTAASAASEVQEQSVKTCAFGAPPDLPYYWEPKCTLQMRGCWADSAHVQCRFCGHAPYTGIPCPRSAVKTTSPDALNAVEVGEVAAEQAATPEDTSSTGVGEVVAEAVVAPEDATLFKAFLAPSAVASATLPHECSFANSPQTPFYWEPQCRMGMVGCNADAKNVQCRFCGEGAYAGIPCRPGGCTFPNEPRTPYFWDEDCAMNVMGCNADGAHVQCRFCVQRPFDAVSCPASFTVVPGRCTFPGAEPTTPHFWDPSCEFGKLGCWADGLHAECRWCGVGAYGDIQCPR